MKDSATTHRRPFGISLGLGIDSEDGSQLPKAVVNEIDINVFNPFSIKDLRASAVGKELMWGALWKSSWYEKYDWFSAPVVPGAYRLQIPVPGSYERTFKEQVALLREGEEPAPIAMVAAALLYMRSVCLSVEVWGRWTRCAEATEDDKRVGLAWRGARLRVFDDWVDFRYETMGLSSVRRLS
jgi:hypothetical protein